MIKVSEDDQNQALGKTKASAIDEKMGTEELDKILQSELNKAD